MKKIIFSFTVIAACSLTAQAVYSTSLPHQSLSGKIVDGGKKSQLSIGSSRETGFMQLRFIADKPGEASIIVLNESGKIVLQQMNHVTNSINIIPLNNATLLPGGSYTVRLISNKKTHITSFLIWE